MCKLANWLLFQVTMSEAQQLFLKLSQLVQNLLQQLPHWWNLPIVLMLFYQFQRRNYLMRNNLFDSYPCNFSGPKYACQDPVVGNISDDRPIGLTQRCTQFRSLGVKVRCALHSHDNVAFTFKWYENTWNKMFYSQRTWIGYNIKLALN